MLYHQVDELVCFTVAAPYAHYNWAASMGVDTDKISFLADPTGQVLYTYNNIYDQYNLCNYYYYYYYYF